MKLITRYILWSWGKLFLISTILLTVGVALFFLVEIVLHRGFPLFIAIRILPYALPEIMTMTVPVTVLFAGCLFYSQMTGANEIIAIKAMGIPPWRVIAPVWGAVLIISLIAVWLNDLAISWGRFEQTRVAIERFEEMVISELRTKNEFSTPNGDIHIEVEKVDAKGLLINPYFSVKGMVRGNAKSAQMMINLRTETPNVTLQFNKATFQFADKVSGILNQKQEIVIPLDKLLNRDLRIEPAMVHIREELQQIEQQRKEYRQNLATRAAFGLVTADYSPLLDPQWAKRIEAERQFDTKRNRARLAFPRRWASGFTCFFFVWVGIPLTILLNRTDHFSGFFVCFIPMLLVYYPLFMLGLEGAKGGTVPPSFVWFGNIVLGIVGFRLLLLIHRR